MNQSDQERVVAKEVTASSRKLNWELPVLLILFVAVIFVAVKNIVHRHESRGLFMQLQKLEKDRDLLLARWSRLKLEQVTKLNQMGVEKKAIERMSMHIPKPSEIKRIHESTRQMDSPVISQPSDAEVALSD